MVLLELSLLHRSEVSPQLQLQRPSPLSMGQIANRPPFPPGMPPPGMMPPGGFPPPGMGPPGMPGFPPPGKIYRLCL